MTTPLQPVGSASPQFGARRPESAGFLQAQLRLYQAKLADWCDCPGGKSPEGKKIITDLQQKADAIRLQIKQSDEVRAHGTDSPSTAATASSASGASSASKSSVPGVAGSRLDVYA